MLKLNSYHYLSDIVTESLLRDSNPVILASSFLYQPDVLRYYREPTERYKGLGTKQKDHYGSGVGTGGLFFGVSI